MYIVNDFVHGVEAGEEAGFLFARHFVGDTWHTKFSANYAVVCGVEAEFDGLRDMSVLVRESPSFDRARVVEASQIEFDHVDHACLE